MHQVNAGSQSQYCDLQDPEDASKSTGKQGSLRPVHRTSDPAAAAARTVSAPLKRLSNLRGGLTSPSRWHTLNDVRLRRRGAVLLNTGPQESLVTCDDTARLTKGARLGGNACLPLLWPLLGAISRRMTSFYPESRSRAPGVKYERPGARPSRAGGSRARRTCPAEGRLRPRSGPAPALRPRPAFSLPGQTAGRGLGPIPRALAGWLGRGSLHPKAPTHAPPVWRRRRG